jgi:hypothetical protein
MSFSSLREVRLLLAMYKLVTPQLITVTKMNALRMCASHIRLARSMAITNGDDKVPDSFTRFESLYGTHMPTSQMFTTKKVNIRQKRGRTVALTVFRGSVASPAMTAMCSPVYIDEFGILLFTG